MINQVVKFVLTELVQGFFSSFALFQNDFLLNCKHCNKLGGVVMGGIFIK